MLFFSVYVAITCFALVSTKRLMGNVDKNQDKSRLFEHDLKVILILSLINL